MPVSISSYSDSWRERRRFFFDQVLIGKRRVRIFVECAHVRVRRQVVEVEIVFLDVLAVIALRAGEPEEAFFEAVVVFVPHRKRKAEMLVDVGDAEDAVFAPAIDALVRDVKRKVVPRFTGCAIVLAHRSPLTIADVRTPLAPLHAILVRGHASVLGGRGLDHSSPSCKACQVRKTSPTLHACAMQPRGSCGGSPSAISANVPTP